MKKVLSKIIKIKSPSLPPKVSFIEEEFKRLKIDAIRWAIVDVQGYELIISVSYLSF